MTANQTKTRWGILGTGSMAVEFGRGLANLPDASLVAVGSRSTESAKKCASRLGATKAHGSYDSLLADPEVDVVYIATVNTSHRDLCLASLDAGKPVLCEKPFTLNAIQAREVVDRARSRRVFCMEAMWTRFLPAVVRLKKLLEEEAIGDPRLFSGRIGYPFEKSHSARHFDPALGGGALLDLGVYPISLAFSLFGRPESIVGKADLTNSSVDAGEAIVMTHPKGRISTLTASITSATSNDGMVMGTLGQIQIHEPIVRPERLTITKVTPIVYSGTGDDGGRMARLKEFPFVRAVYRQVRPILAKFKSGEGRTLALPCIGNGYAHEAAEVMRCLRDGLLESPIMPLDESVAILETMDSLRHKWGVKFPGE